MPLSSLSQRRWLWKKVQEGAVCHKEAFWRSRCSYSGLVACWRLLGCTMWTFFHRITGTALPNCNLLVCSAVHVIVSESVRVHFTAMNCTAVFVFFSATCCVDVGVGWSWGPEVTFQIFHYVVGIQTRFQSYPIFRAVKAYHQTSSEVTNCREVQQNQMRSLDAGMYCRCLCQNIQPFIQLFFMLDNLWQCNGILWMSQAHWSPVVSM